MKIAYFDCFSGISGDMILGALIDAGLTPENLTRIISELNLRDCRIEIEKTKKGSISATRVNIIVPPKERKSPATFLNLLDSLDLPLPQKEKSKNIFLSIARAEAQIHRENIEDLHLHELGSLDTLIDIVGAVIGIHQMGIKKIYASPVNLGRGIVDTAHGLLPVPAPATLEILKGAPVYSGEVEAELTTPTGAAILMGFSPVFGPIPCMKIEKIGYGAGQKELPFPNLLRIIIGKEKSQFNEDWVILLETNIDDMNPEFYEYIIDSLFKCGALDDFGERNQLLAGMEQMLNLARETQKAKQNGQISLFGGQTEVTIPFFPSVLIRNFSKSERAFI